MIDQAGPTSSFQVIAKGGITSAKGFKASGIHAGFRANPNRRDLALIVADEPCACAAMFTQNVFCAAPVVVSKAHLVKDDPNMSPAAGVARAVIVNSGNANAATGLEGLRVANEVASITADVVGCAPEEVMVASTGVIGVQLPLDTFETGVPQAAEALSSTGGADAAQAIMTTDTHPKECALTFSGDDIGYEGHTFTVGGAAKGSGMIMPNMATMIAILTTDAPLEPPLLARALKGAVDKSFNKVTVDSDTSTNDSCYLLASGKAACGCVAFREDSPAYTVFCEALDTVCTTLAKAIAADGEGATKFVTVNVFGAATEVDADAAARTVANSPLVKTAIYGHDANWGRIAMALGRSGAKFSQDRVDIAIMGIPVCHHGLGLSFDEADALKRFENPEIVIDVDLGAGSASSTIWTCDLTHDYITINGDYRT